MNMKYTLRGSEVDLNWLIRNSMKSLKRKLESPCKRYEKKLIQLDAKKDILILRRPLLSIVRILKPLNFCTFESKIGKNDTSMILLSILIFTRNFLETRSISFNLSQSLFFCGLLRWLTSIYIQIRIYDFLTVLNMCTYTAF